jgi:membrane protein YdbS with pleckstrin-like domain
MNTQNSAVWQKILSKDEVVKEEFSISNSYIKFCGILWSILYAIFTIFLFGLGALIPIFYYFFYLKRANIYAFTNKRVLIHKGWLSTNLTSVDYSKITDIYVSEDWIQKLLTKSGTIKVNTAGSGGEEVVFKNVANPYKLKKLLDELKD